MSDDISNTMRKPTQMERWQTLKAIDHAEEVMASGRMDDISLGTFILRDSPMVKVKESLSDLAWSMTKETISKNDVLALIEYIKRELADSQ